MNKEEYHAIEMRTRFWVNTSYEIEQCYKHVKAEPGYKWCNPDDVAKLHEAEDMLKKIFAYSIEQQRTAIDVQINALNTDEEKKQCEPTQKK